MTLQATKATTINVSGNDGLNLTNTGNTKVTTFDASGVVANDASDTAANMAVTFVSANTSTLATVSITGGEGNDKLTGNAGVDTIIGGKGDDTITASAGNDVSTGGLGNDTFAFTGALLANNSETTATFDGGEGTDIVDITTDAATIVDADFRGITSVETLTTGDGANNITLGVNADTTGIKTIVGGTGADTIDLSSVDFDNAVSITGGAGADVIKLAAGTDQVATIVYDAAGFIINSQDAISGFTVGIDKISFATAIEATLIANGSAGAGGTVTEATNATTFSAATDNLVQYWDDGTDTYIMISEAADAAFTAAADFSIKLVGLTGGTAGYNHTITLSADGVLTIA